MKLRVLGSLFFLGLLVLLQSCKTTQQSSFSSKDLERKWILKSINGESASSLFSHKIPTLVLNLEEGRLSGNGGCNQYNGAFVLTKNKFSAPNIASTMMMCPGANSEGLFLQALSNNSEISLNKELLVFSQNGKTVLEFEKEKPLTVADLSGEWELQSIQGASANVYFKEKVPTIRFDAQTNRVSGNSGCNTYNAPFELKDGKLEIKPMMTTRMACIDGMEGESKYTKILPGISEVELENGQLTLRRDRLHIATFKRK